MKRGHLPKLVGLTKTSITLKKGRFINLTSG